MGSGDERARRRRVDRGIGGVKRLAHYRGTSLGPRAQFAMECGAESRFRGAGPDAIIPFGMRQDASPKAINGAFGGGGDQQDLEERTLRRFTRCQANRNAAPKANMAHVPGSGTLLAVNVGLCNSG